MTPEERLRRIENLLKTTAQQQANQQEQLGKYGRDIDKHNETIRGLIVVGRTCLDSIKELREAQSVTDEKLNGLIDNVDRIVRRENHP